MSEWLKEMGCKPIGYAYAGSNPAPPTRSLALRPRRHDPRGRFHAEAGAMPTLSETPASRAKRQRFRGAAGLLLVVHSGTEPTSVTTAFSPQATVRLMPSARVRPA